MKQTPPAESWKHKTHFWVNNEKPKFGSKINEKQFLCSQKTSDDGDPKWKKVTAHTIPVGNTGKACSWGPPPKDDKTYSNINHSNIAKMCQIQNAVTRSIGAIPFILNGSKLYLLCPKQCLYLSQLVLKPR